MGAELVGQQVRVRIRNPDIFSGFRIKDVGKRGRLQIVFGRKDGTWLTQAYRFNMQDYHNYHDFLGDLHSTRVKNKNISKADDIAREWFKSNKVHVRQHKRGVRVAHRGKIR